MKMKKLLAWLVLFSLLASLSPLPALADVIDIGVTLPGAGTEGDPYIVRSAKDLKRVSDRSRNGDRFQNCWIVMTADVDLSELATGTDPYWHVISPDEDNAFDGVFDGRGHTVSGLTINTGDSFLGLFGFVSGTVKNLTVNGEISGNDVLGLVAGFSTGRLENCHVRGSVSGDINVGGIVGRGYGEIIGCSSTAEVSGSSNVGGIVGYANNTISGCRNKWLVNGSGKYVGGVVGYHENGGVLMNCVNHARVQSQSEYVGGVAGAACRPVSGCRNLGAVNGKNYVGGVAGTNQYAGSMVGCVNSGTVVGGQRNLLGEVTDGGEYVGGVTGYAESPVTDCGTTEDSVVRGDHWVAGVAGAVYNCDTSGCFNLGSVSGRQSVGGVVGNQNHHVLRYCFNEGPIHGTGDFVGGVIGYMYNGGGIYECCNTGYVNGDSVEGCPWSVGGIVGYSHDTDVWDCYNTGNINGSGRVGGIVGMLDLAKLDRTYTIGHVNGAMKSGLVIGHRWILNLEGDPIRNNYYYDYTGAPDDYYGPGSHDDEEVKAFSMKEFDEHDMSLFAGFSNDIWYMTDEGPKLRNVTGFDSTIEIRSLGDLFALREKVNASGMGYAGVTVRLETDIDLGGVEWTPIASGYGSGGANCFYGTFDGNGHSITGLVISGYEDEAGLFGTLGGTVKDLTVVGSVRGGEGVGGIAGVMTGGTLERVAFHGDVTGSAYVGGLAGMAVYAEIRDCVVEGSVSGEPYEEGADSELALTGGLVGSLSNATVECCEALCDVSGCYGVGGIAGNMSGGTVKDCAHLGTVSGGSYLGGLVAVVNAGSKLFTSYHYTGGINAALGLAGGVAALNSAVGQMGGIRGCYYLADTAACGVASGFGASGEDAEGVAQALSAAQFTDSASFESWDFENVWSMGPDRPGLQGNNTVVSFDANGGEGTMLNQLIPPTGGTLKPCEFTREGHDFLGWSTETDGSGTYYAESGLFLGSVSKTLYALWGERETVSYVDSTTGRTTERTCYITREGGPLCMIMVDGWYAIDGIVRMNRRLEIRGDVNLVLTDEAWVDIPLGIHVPAGSSLTVWGQEGRRYVPNEDVTVTGGGQLFADSFTTSERRERGDNAAIGGNKGEDGGVITFNGGSICAVGFTGAGVGGGREGTSGLVTVNGAYLEASTMSGGAGIGGGVQGNGGNVEVVSGFVRATGSFYRIDSNAYVYSWVASPGIGAGAPDYLTLLYNPQGGTGHPEENFLESGNLTVQYGWVVASSGVWTEDMGGRNYPANAVGVNLLFYDEDPERPGNYEYPNGYDRNHGRVGFVTLGDVRVAGQEELYYYDRDVFCREPSVRLEPCEVHQPFINSEGSATVKCMLCGNSSFYMIRYNNASRDGAARYEGVTPGHSLRLYEPPFNYNYVFYGWDTSEDGTGTRYAGGEQITPTQNLDLYGLFTWGVRKTYVDAMGTVQPARDCQEVGYSVSRYRRGWYYLSANQTVTDRIEIVGDVNLVLAEGVTIDAQKGFHVPEGSSLTVWSETPGAGTILARYDSGGAAIGGDEHETGGAVTIHGGTVTATGAEGAAGIGGGLFAGGGVCVVDGGVVTATGGAKGGAGIGGGVQGNGGTVTILGGTVTASGTDGGAGIGGGKGGAGGEANLRGGEVTASGYQAVGKGEGGIGEGTLRLGNVRLKPLANGGQSPGTVRPYYCHSALVELIPCTAHEMEDGACRWCCTSELTYYDPFDGTEKVCAAYTPLDEVTTALRTGWYAAGGSVSIESVVTVSGEVNLILCDGCTLNTQNVEVTPGSSLTIWGQTEGTGTLTAAGTEDWAAGIGGTERLDAGAVTINGGVVNATGGYSAAGIGGGFNAGGGTITINAGIVTAVGGYAAAGIGGASGEGGRITITGGTVNATGGYDGTGIGSGDIAATGTIVITGGVVTAAGQGRATGIGGSWGGSVTISGAVVNAAAGPEGGQAIGSSTGSSSGPRLTLIDMRAYPSAEAAEPVGAGALTETCHGAAVRLEPCAEHEKVDGACVWCGAADHYLLHLEANGGEGTMADYERLFGQTAALAPNAFTREGWRFLGWNTAEDGSGLYYADGASVSVTENLTLYAQWAQLIEISYVDENGAEQTAEAALLTAETLYLPGGRYAAQGETTLGARLTLLGDVELILADGCLLNAPAGIGVDEGTSLTVYGQSGLYELPGEGIGTRGTGRLTASSGDDQAAAIGGGKGATAGDVTIHGGIVTANGNWGAGIGAGDVGTCGTITVTDGCVIAAGGGGSAGIGGGGGSDGGTVEIRGGYVSATGSSYNGQAAAGIGAGRPRVVSGEPESLSGGSVSITGGIVVATAGPAGGNGTAAQAIGVNRANVDSGSLSIGEGYRVDAGDFAASAAPAVLAAQEAACRSEYARIAPCAAHSSAEADGHLCAWCGAESFCRIRFKPFYDEPVEQTIWVPTGSSVTLPLCPFYREGYEFYIWRGYDDLTQETLTCEDGATLTVLHDMTLSASWSKQKYLLTTEGRTEHGVVKLSYSYGDSMNNYSHNFFYNEEVSITTIPDEGYFVVSVWANEDLLPANAGDYSVITFRMPAEAVNVTAVFAEIPSYPISAVGVTILDEHYHLITEAKEGTPLRVFLNEREDWPEGKYWDGEFLVNGRNRTVEDYWDPCFDLTMPGRNLKVEAVFLDQLSETIDLTAGTAEVPAKPIWASGAFSDPTELGPILQSIEEPAAMLMDFDEEENDGEEDEPLYLQYLDETYCIPVWLNEDADPDIAVSEPDENDMCLAKVLPGAAILGESYVVDLTSYHDKYATVTYLFSSGGPLIAVQPQDWEGQPGDYPAISITAEGEGLSYQWYYRDAGKTDWSLSSDQDECYDSYPLNLMRNGREVYCVVTDAEGKSTASDIAVMRFTVPEDWEGPRITVQPEPWTGASGELPAVSVEAEGEGLTYQWYYRDAGEETWHKSSEQDECYDSYPLTEIRARRELYCVVTDQYGLIDVSETVLMDYELPEDYAEPTILAEPGDWTGMMDEYPAITFSVEGEELSYQWYYRDAGKEKWSKSSETDECYDSYSLTMNRAGRELYCVASDPYGRSITSRIVTMDFDVPEGWTGPEILAEPENWAGVMGEYPDVTFSVEGTELSYQWYYRDAGEETWHKSSEKDECYDSYPLTTSRAGRELYCVVTDPYGFSVTSGIVTMDFDVPEDWTGPEILAEPASWAGNMDEYPAITFSVEGEGVSYQWYYRDAGEETWHKSSETDDCYNAYPLSSARAGREVFCVATDQYGFSVTSAIAVMDVLEEGVELFSLQMIEAERPTEEEILAADDKTEEMDRAPDEDEEEEKAVDDDSSEPEEDEEAAEEAAVDENE